MNEVKKITEDKKAWVDEIAKLLRKDRRSGVKNITYDKRGVGLEIVTITFKGGDESMINVSYNSLGKILEEIDREVYGNGAYGKINPEERWW